MLSVHTPTTSLLASRAAYTCLRTATTVTNSSPSTLGSRNGSMGINTNNNYGFVAPIGASAANVLNPRRGMKIIAKTKDDSKSDMKIRKIQGKDVFVDDKTDTIYTKNSFPHLLFTKEDMEAVGITHRVPRTFRDRYASWLVTLLRFGFDLFTGYRHPNVKMSRDGKTEPGIGNYKLTPEKWMSRFIFLESIAGVPGMVGAFLRQLHSLRLLKRDKAWIETLVDEAYNERMHLLTFIQIGKPGILTRAFLYVAQGVFANMFFFSYMFTPKTCHRFVGYLEEEAVITYTHCIADLDAGLLPDLANVQVPDIALAYWNMKPDALFRDLILYIRADEAKHREVNHTLANLRQEADRNPFAFVADDTRPQPVNDFSEYKGQGWERNEIAKVCDKPSK